MKKMLFATILILCPYVFGGENAAVKAMVESAKKTKDKKTTITLLEQALKLDGTYFEAHYELCKLYQASYSKTYKKEAKEEARKKLREVLRNAHNVGMSMPDKERKGAFNKQLDEIIKMREKHDKAASEVQRQAHMWVVEANNLRKKGDEDWKIYMEAAKKLGFEESLVPTPNLKTPTDTKIFKGHRYKVFEEKLTWEEAKKKCEKLSGYLVCISSEEENQFINSIRNNRNVWIGLYKGGQWKWVNGQKTEYVSWAPGEPNKPNSEIHGGMLGNTNGWYDLPADGGNREQWSIQAFICEWD